MLLGEVERQFADAMRDAGLTPPDVLEADGRIHRCSANGRPSDDAGWYILHADAFPAGTFGSWRDGWKKSWRASGGRDLSAADKAAMQERFACMKAERKKAWDEMRKDARVQALEAWNKGSPATDAHPYLIKKGIKAHGIRRDGSGRLIVPVFRYGELSSVQHISPSGEKRFFKGGEISGGLYTIGALEGAATVCITEGFGTGASIAEATGHPVVICFSAGNLVEIAEQVRRDNPTADIVICGDDDFMLDRNTGHIAAQLAAQKIGARLAMPVFSSPRPEKATDFNDLAALAGLPAVKSLVDSAQLVPASRDHRDSREPLPGGPDDVPESMLLAGAASLEEPEFSFDKPAGGLRPRARFEQYGNVAGLQDGVYWIGVHYDKTTDSYMEDDPVWICSPLTVAATTRDVNSSEWGRLLVFRDRDGVEHKWAMPMAMAAGAGEGVRAELLRQGLEITSNPRHRLRLVDYIQWEKPALSATSVARTGWHDNVFVLPHRSYGDDPAQPVFFQTASPENATIRTRGTLKDWRERIAARCVGNTRLVLAISAAFAGPCLGLVDSEGGGLHLRGGSSGGKTTALAAAASVCGPRAYSRTWRQTDNALEGVAALHSDLLLILDELGQLDPKVAGSCAYLLANGQGKGRANREGAAKPTTTFRTLFLSAGEIGLCDLVEQNGGKIRAGQEVRVVDVPADAGKGCGLFDCIPDGLTPGQFADEIKGSAAMYYGVALDEFLRAVTNDYVRAEEFIRTSIAAFRTSVECNVVDGQVRRVIGRFALVAAAGELAADMGITGWLRGEATKAAIACLSAWIAARGNVRNAEPAAMLACVRGFLEAHGEARFTPWDCKSETRTPNRAGFRRATPDGPEYYIEREVFKREVAAGYNHQVVARLLAQLGVLMVDSDNGTTRKERLPDGRTTRVYRITPAIWNVDA